MQTNLGCFNWNYLERRSNSFSHRSDEEIRGDAAHKRFHRFDLVKSPARRSVIEREIRDVLEALDAAIMGLRKGHFPKDRHLIADQLSIARQHIGSSKAFKEWREQTVERENTREIKHVLYEDIFRVGKYRKE